MNSMVDLSSSFFVSPLTISGLHIWSSSVASGHHGHGKGRNHHPWLVRCIELGYELGSGDDPAAMMTPEGVSLIRKKRSEHGWARNTPSVFLKKI